MTLQRGNVNGDGAVGTPWAVRTLSGRGIGSRSAWALAALRAGLTGEYPVAQAVRVLIDECELQYELMATLADYAVAAENRSDS